MIFRKKPKQKSYDKNKRDELVGVMKASEEANSRYNEVLNYGFDTEEQSND